MLTAFFNNVVEEQLFAKDFQVTTSKMLRNWLLFKY